MIVSEDQNLEDTDPKNDRKEYFEDTNFAFRGMDFVCVVDTLGGTVYKSKNPSFAVRQTKCDYIGPVLHN